MFPLHYKTRRFFCRIGFALLCLAPTAGVLAWSGWLQTDGYVAAWCEEIERRTGLQAKIEAVTHPEPRVAILEGVQLSDPRTHERLLYVPRLEIAMRGSQRLLIATGPELHAQAQPTLTTLAEGCWRELEVTTIAIASSLTLHGEFGDERLKQVDVRAFCSTAGSELKCQFRLERSNAASPARMHFIRPKDPQEQTLVEFDTGGDDLPLALLPKHFVANGNWGGETTFQGTARLGYDERGWQGEVRGSLRQIDLKHAVAGNFPHRIEGQGELWLERLQIVDSRLSEAVGAFSGGPGLIGPSLRLAAANELGFFASEVARETHGLLEYEQLAFDFKLNNEGLQLRGRCSQGAPGAVIIDDYGLLLGESRRQPISIAALVRTLAPPSESFVPATRDAAWLLDRLPAAR